MNDIATALRPGTFEPVRGNIAQRSCENSKGCMRQFGCPARHDGAGKAGSGVSLACGALPITLHGRQPLFEAGEASGHVYMVQSGCVAECQYRLDGSRHIVAFHFPDDLVGLTWTGVHQWSAEATCATAVMPIELRSLPKAMAFDCRLRTLLAEQLARQQRGLDAHLALLARTTTAERMAAFILELRDRLCRGGPPARTVDLRMRRADIADHLGMSVETVSRSLGELKHSGVLRLLSTNVVEIVDAVKLAAVASRDEGPCYASRSDILAA